MQHFLLKLIPPRPTFPQDMNDEEKQLMQQHAEYMKQLQTQGIALAYGPVFERKGAWGLGILEVENEESAKKLILNDPTIKAALNTFELHPMKAVVKRD